MFPDIFAVRIIILRYIPLGSFQTCVNFENIFRPDTGTHVTRAADNITIVLLNIFYFLRNAQRIRAADERLSFKSRIPVHHIHTRVVYTYWKRTLVLARIEFEIVRKRTGKKKTIIIVGNELACRSCPSREYRMPINLLPNIA